MYGYWGRILRVDLSSRKTWVQEFDEAWARKYVGGRGIAAALLWDETGPDTDPLGPDNRLVFACGPVTGMPVAGAGRSHVMARSPLTGGYGESSAGGGFGPQMRHAGYDAIVVQGVADRPVYLWVHDGEVQLCDAQHLWGLPTGLAQDRILAEVGDPKAIVVAIGPAGERRQPLASIIAEKHRASGRTGMGAVMGAKNLKAVAVRGTSRPPAANLEGLRELAKRIVRLTMDGARGQAIRQYGTALGIMGHQAMGILPTENFRRGVFSGAKNISAEAMAERYTVGRYACPHCPIGCARKVTIPNGPFGPVGPEYGGPEYETLAAFGSNCLVDNLEAIAQANQLCNMYGMDTISIGSTIAWAMECYERGLLTAADLDGLELRWGDAAAMVALVRKMGEGEGAGALLAQGVLRASQAVGGGSADFAMQVKGLEVPFHEPRGKVAVALMYATAPRGAVHTGYAHDTDFEQENSMPELGIVEKLSRFSIAGKPPLMKLTNDATIALELMGTCGIPVSPIRSPIRIDISLDVLRCVTGWDMDMDEFVRAGERANNLARAFNVRLGKARNADTLPKRFTEPLPDGPSAGHRITPADFEAMLDEYYQVRGWDANGVPTRAKLSELDLDHLADSLEVTGP